jgi:hypothetical protein
LADLFIVGVAPIDYGPILLLKPFGFRIAPDTLSSNGFRRWLARHYPHLWIRRSSFERRRDLNPPDSCAAQRTLRTHPTSRQCTQSTFTTFAFVVSPVISLRRLAIAVVSSMMLLAMNPFLYLSLIFSAT